MHEAKAQLGMAVGLTAIAGWVDAIGFLTLKHLFVSFMSGNSTQLAVAAAGRNWSDAGAAASLVGLFILGVCGGHLLAVEIGAWSRPVILATEAALLILGSSLTSAPPVLAVPMVFAMGIQNSVVRKVGDTQTNLTYVTGTLVHLGEKMVDAVRSPAGKARWAWIPYLLLWAGLVAGAAGGAGAYHVLQIRALLVPAAVLLALAMATAPCMRGQ